MNRSICSVDNSGRYLNYLPNQQSLMLTDLSPFAAPPVWIFDPLGPANSLFFRIHCESLPDLFLHVETGELAIEPIHFGANSSYWFLEPTEKHDTFIIRNFWRQNYYIYRDGEVVKAGSLEDPLNAVYAHWIIQEPGQGRILVPVHLDALWLLHEQAVVAPTADFTRLPHFNGVRDINPNTAHISESILNPPLAPPQLYLKSGLHLHWALPDALHRGVQESSGLHLPQVPDRWLVTKRVGETSQRWIVESNYLYSPENSAGRHSISYPITDGINPHPYRHMGRKVPLSDWRERDVDGTHPDYLHSLTAFGYGEPNFAAFYPNCYSVFGFYDTQSEGQPLAELKNTTYEIIGWHSSQDILQDKGLGKVIDDLLKNRPDADRLSIVPYKFAALESDFGWIIDQSESLPFPLGTLYFARLTIAVDVVDAGQTILQPKIVIGNTPTEALSSHLGLEIGGSSNWRILEEQLEALMLMPEVEGETLDTSAKFAEVRHSQGFKGLHGGVVTTLTPTSKEDSPADAHNSPYHLEAYLPWEIAGLLDQLNQLESQLFQGKAEMQSLREQLFSDWYKYMLTAYPPQDSHDNFPDVDEIAHFIEHGSLKGLVAHRERLEADVLDSEGNESILRQRNNARMALAQMVESLQMLYPSDIKDWSHFLDILTGKISLNEVVFQPVMSWLVGQLPEVEHALLLQQPRFGQFSEQAKAVVESLNTFIPMLPQTLFTEDVTALLPAEARQLVGRFATLNYTDKQRLGRLVLESALPGTLARRSKYRLEEIPAPRYWEPFDPVVLIADADLRLTERHGEDGRLRDDGLLTCYYVPLPISPDGEPPTLDEIFNTIEIAINGVAAGLKNQFTNTEGHIGFYTWRHQPWHPFMLEWAAEFFQLKENGNHEQPERGYATDYISRHYEFPEDRADLKPKQEAQTLVQTGSVYSGRTIMLDYAQPLLVQRLEAYCGKYLAPRYYEARNISPAERPNKPPLSDISIWAAENKDKLSQFDQVVVAIQAHLAQNTTPPIAQALNGFHAALLQHRQTLQLPIADPLGFPKGKALAAAVEQAAGDANLRAPKPEDAFNPIRAGALRLLGLRLVDTFGQILSIFDGQPGQFVQGSEPFSQLDPHTLLLPPRFTQPARINSYWLSANGGQAAGEAEMVSNAHPATSPICGWFVPNYYDNSLLVYNQAGQPLGSLSGRDEGVIWTSAPGRQHRLLEADILNEHLYRLVDLFLKQDSNYLEDTLTGIESALENIIPSSQQSSLALLVGRPLAVVRLSVALTLLGKPATDQSWNQFRQTLITHKRDSAGFPDVTFPLRIGEQARLNDGLLAFWCEKKMVGGETAVLDKTLYLPQTPDTIRTSSIDHPAIVMHRPGMTPHLALSLNAPPFILTMLVDPRAAVHISSGILPVKTMTIPTELYLPGLQNLEMTFFTGPFVTGKDKVELPLPTEPGYTWSLLTKENGAWNDSQAIGPVEQNATLSQPHIIREGWLKLKKDGETQ